MFNNNKEERVCSLTQRVVTLESKIKQLECKHKKTEMKTDCVRGFIRLYYCEVCLLCGKTLQVFDSEIDYRKAVVKGLEKQLKTETAKLKETNGK